MEQWAEGRCYCGRVQIGVSRPPEQVVECHCSICRRYGALWFSHQRSQVTTTGLMVLYAWGPKDVGFHRCGDCGCVIAWFALDAALDLCGVNARLLDRFDARAVRRLVEDHWPLAEEAIDLREPRSA